MRKSRHCYARFNFRQDPTLPYEELHSWLIILGKTQLGLGVRQSHVLELVENSALILILG